MALTINGKLLIAHILGGGLGYNGLSSSSTFQLKATTNESNYISSAANVIFSSSSGTSSGSQGMSAYVGYGDIPTDRHLDTSIRSYPLYNSVKSPTSNYSSIESGINRLSITITNSSSSVTRTYNRYGMMLVNTYLYILSYYNLPEPITLQPGESKTIDLTFDFSNL